jgi:hypothetical protein
VLSHDGGQLVDPGGWEVEGDGRDVLAVLDLDPLLAPGGQRDLPCARDREFPVSALGHDSPGDRLDEAAGPDGRVAEPPFDLVPDGALP